MLRKRPNHGVVRRAGLFLELSRSRCRFPWLSRCFRASLFPGGKAATTHRPQRWCCHSLGSSGGGTCSVRPSRIPTCYLIRPRGC